MKHISRKIFLRRSFNRDAGKNLQ